MASDRGDDVVRGAERQMLEHEIGQVTRLFAKMSARFSVPEREEDIPTEDEMREEIRRLLEDDPDARELVEALAAYREFRSQTDEEAS